MSTHRDVSILKRIAVAIPIFAAAAFAGYVAWSELPREQARNALNALSDGTELGRDTAQEALQNLETAASRFPMNGSHRIAQARLVLFLMPPEPEEAASVQAQLASKYFVDGLRLKPNARGAWRGVFASTYVSKGPSPELARVFEGAYLFDSGAPFSALTLMSVVLRHPGFVPAERYEQVLSFAQPLYDTWYMRRPMARVYVTLPEDAQTSLRRSLVQGDAFAKWAERLAAEDAAK